MRGLVTGAGGFISSHLAALIAIPYSYIAPQQFLAVNCTGTLNLLEAARSSGVERFIHTSTSETYGTAQYTPMDKKHALKSSPPTQPARSALRGCGLCPGRQLPRGQRHQDVGHPG